MDTKGLRTRERKPAPAGHVLVTGVVMLVLASVLNAPALVETANRQPHGLKRDVALTLVRPLAAMSSALRLDVPRTFMDRALGRDATADEITDPEPAFPPPTMAPDGPPLRRPTASDPLRTWIVGDSLVELFGPHLARMLGDTEVFDPEVDFRFISGLSRPDYFDWPAHIRRSLARTDVEAVVAMFGGNDGQSVAVDGEVYEVWTPAWWDLYRERIGEAMDALRPGGRVYWVGLPIMRSDDFSARARQMNRAYRAEADERPWVTFVDTWSVLADERGRYADYLPDASGNLRPMRYQDGVHPTPHGAVRLARHVTNVLEAELGLDDR